MQIRVCDLMNRRAPTIGQTSSVSEAIERLFESEATQLYVVDGDDHPVGVVPDYELLKCHVSGQAECATVATVMTSGFETVTPDDLVLTLMPRFRTAFCRSVAVIDKGRLVGELTRRDVLWLAVTLERIQSEPDSAEPMPEDLSDPDVPHDAAHTVSGPVFLRRTKRSRAGRARMGR